MILKAHALELATGKNTRLLGMMDQIEMEWRSRRKTTVLSASFHQTSHGELPGLGLHLHRANEGAVAEIREGSEATCYIYSYKLNYIHDFLEVHTGHNFPIKPGTFE